MMNTMKMILVAVLIAGFSSLAFAIEPISKESGFSGFVNIGGLGLKAKNNMVAEASITMASRFRGARTRRLLVTELSPQASEGISTERASNLKREWRTRRYVSTSAN